MDRTSTRNSRLIGALIGAVAALSIGGVGMAFAQEAETPTTEAPAAEAPAPPAAPGERGDREDCPEKDGAADGGASTSAADEV